MKLLIDTHILVWLVQNPKEISRREMQALRRAVGSTYVSAVSLLEIRIKFEKLARLNKRARYPDPEKAYEFARAGGYHIEPLTPELCVASLRNRVDHRDPFDELLLIHAEQLGARILTRDDEMSAHPLALAP